MNLIWIIRLNTPNPVWKPESQDVGLRTQGRACKQLVVGFKVGKVLVTPLPQVQQIYQPLSCGNQPLKRLLVCGQP